MVAGTCKHHGQCWSSMAAHVVSFCGLTRLHFLLCSRGFENEVDQEEEEETEDEETEEDEMAEENTPPRQSGRRVTFQRERLVEKKPITVDEKGEPYGALVGAFHADLRSLAMDLDPNGNFVEQTEATKDRFFKRLWQGTA